MSDLSNLIVKTLEEKKGRDIIVIDFRNESSLCDAFIICDAPSIRQINALCDDVIEALEKEAYPIKNVERSAESTWILIDAIDVVVHIFQSDERSRYDLESLYRDYLSRQSL